MSDETAAQERTAASPTAALDGPVTLINSFAVPAGRDDVFTELWRQTSGFFRAQPGVVSLTLHRAVRPDAQYRYVNVATWRSWPEFQAAHAREEFRALVSAPEWREFPNSPNLYQVAAASPERSDAAA